LISLLSSCLLVLVFPITSIRADDHPGEGNLTAVLLEDSNRGFHIGDACTDGCSSVLENSYCDNNTNTCQCLDSHPIEIETVTCVDPKNLYESCTYNQQCSKQNKNSFCKKEEQQSTRCRCRKGYREERAHDIPIRYECVIDATGPLSGTVPAIVGLFIALTILLILFCFMFKLFTQSRYPRARAYADANQDPPDITVEDEQIDLEKQRLYPETCGIQIYSPGGGHISKQSSRRGSGNNNSDKASLSNYSQSQSRRGSNRSSGGESEKSRRASLARNGAIVTSDLAFNFNDKDCDVEQHITIIPNPRAKRRGSMADHAFPELHSSRSTKKEPENLLILTRTKTDRHGRRHSVAVPLIPPPDGEKFEGGYHVERNPVTGGAKLVPPQGDSKGGSSSKVKRTRSISERRGLVEGQSSHTPSKSKASHHTEHQASSSHATNVKHPQKDLLSTQFVISKNQKCAWLVSRTDSTVRRRGHNLSMPTIGETSIGEISANSPTIPINGNGNTRRPFRTRSCRLPSSSSSTTSRRVLMQPRSRSLGLEVPGGGASSKRRHSFQSGVPGLTKEMDRLKVSHTAAEGGGHHSRGVSPRGSTRRRASAARRTSRGFLHFLDLAIAN